MPVENYDRLSAKLDQETSLLQMPGPALTSQQPHAMVQDWGRVAGKLPSGKGPGGAGQQPAEHEPRVGPGGQEGQRHPGLHQK